MISEVGSACGFFLMRLSGAQINSGPSAHNVMKRSGLHTCAVYLQRRLNVTAKEHCEVSQS